ncbi:putative pre-rrna processing protein utp22 protein [Venustampulla echinocandica]|uniref:U3 small nucleolar RNA-associated protein 22 n=1 Tax=Venustampulla echinocandica TaxID=2656787 RepID=A0A370TDG2_9HELO|nr:putative pre-rrna processing protein utp22 protein [Venustampulla echinocandica]RDL32495.1 putative pre-rrna processing protein utp22 protein [Venustampulla echinocandica]
MSHIPSKRRKLDHANSKDESHLLGELQPDAKLGQLDDDSGNSSEDDQRSLEHDMSTSKPQAQGNSLSNRLKDDDEHALYAGGLFKSSMFKLQVDEMLRELRPNYERRLRGADDMLRKLKAWIEDIRDSDELSPADCVKTLFKSHKISVPFPDPKPDKNAAYKLGYQRPSRINVVGSYTLNTMIKTDAVLSIDMVVVMPASIFQEKDYLNYRYFYKRAYYLACIAAGLQDVVRDEYTLSFKYLGGNTLHPILVVKPKSNEDKPHSEFEIRIIPAAPTGFFAESKLRPEKNSVRQKDAAGGNSTSHPTPFYNASLRADGNFEAYLKLLHAASKLSDGFLDTCRLGRIWLRQRGFGSCMSEGGFGHFEWAALVALLLRGGGPKGNSLLSPGYSSYQMFKAVLQFLSTNNLADKPVIYQGSEAIISKSGHPMLYDGPRGQNLLYKMTPWSYGLLRDETAISLEMLNDETFDQFEPTFTQRTSQALQRYDCIVRVPVPRNPGGLVHCDHTSDMMSFGHRIYDVLREGLTDRVRLIDIKISKPSAWSIKSSGPPVSENSLLVAVIFDPLNIGRLVDHGPSAEERKKAAKFQNFWGEKAELRRFKDGSILESLVWKAGSTSSIFQDIVSYLVARHFGIEVAGGLSFIGEGFETALASPGIAGKLFDVLKQAFQVFQKDVTNLEGLPLQLRQLSPISPQLRYTSIEPPSFSPHHPLQTPADVLIQFEGSGRWPDGIVAIQRTKIAFLLKIGALLQESNNIIETRLGLENGDQPLQNCAFLDVIYESGAVFRLRIHNDREQALLERIIKDKSADPQTREDAVSAMSTYKRMFIQLPLLAQSIATHCTRFPLLSPTIRLTKLWFDRHMLSGHISDELIELIVSRTFLQPYPWRAPSSVMTGFLRTLMFISRWDWRLMPLVVDFSGTMTGEDVASINTRLDAWRKIDPGMNRTVLVAASSHDTSGIAFTDTGPSKVVAARMSALASSAYKLVKHKGLELDQRSLFAASTTDYDFVIHLSKGFTGRLKQKESSRQRFKNLEVQSKANLDLVGYQPVELFLNEVGSLYTSHVVFFHSQAAPTVIAGLWNPQAVSSRPFKVNLAYATKVSGGSGKEKENDGENEVEMDKSAILSEIARLGGDMISRIEVH